MTTPPPRVRGTMQLDADAPVNQSVERAMQLLGFFSAEERELTLAQLTARLGASKPTTHRYTLALRRTGLLRFDASRGVYSLGVRLVELAAAALSGLRVATIAQPHVERFVASAGQSAVLSIWDGHAPIVVVGADSVDRLVRISIPHGSRLGMSSASGRIFAAFDAEVPPDEAGDERELAVIREGRFAVDRDQLHECIRTIAAPVFQAGKVVAALALVGTTSAIPAEAGSALAVTLCASAQELSDELGLND